MAGESKKREVLQLLKDYRAWHTPHGGAMPLDETGVMDASYGPAGLIEARQGFEKEHRARLTKTYRDLDHALKLLKAVYHDLWITLRRPYLSDTADLSVVAEWRRKAERGNKDAQGTVELHDLAVRVLAILLHGVDLYVVFPKRMTSREEKQVERRNDEFFALYRRYRDEERMSQNKAIETAAEHCGYGRSRGYEIVDLREGRTR
jgi:hypothetical protein